MQANLPLGQDTRHVVAPVPAREAIERFILGTVDRWAKLGAGVGPQVHELVQAASHMFPATDVRQVCEDLQHTGWLGLVDGILLHTQPSVAHRFQMHYGVRAIFRHANGHETIRPLRLGGEDWLVLLPAGIYPARSTGYTAVEAMRTVQLALPLLRRRHATFLAVPGTSVQLDTHLID